MKKLTKGDVTVYRSFIPGGSGMVTIKDFNTDTYITLYPEEAKFLRDALMELLTFNGDGYTLPPDQL